MNRTEAQFQVGDEILKQPHYHIDSVVKVVRVTKTQAILSDGERLKRTHYVNDKKKFSITAMGSTGYHRTRYRNIEPGDFARIKRETKIAKAKAWFGSKEWNDMEILNLYNESKK